MNNDLGIEIKCENCEYCTMLVGNRVCDKDACADSDDKSKWFIPSPEAYESRICQLKAMVMQAAIAAEKVPQLERRVKELTEENKELLEREIGVPRDIFTRENILLALRAARNLAHDYLRMEELPECTQKKDLETYFEESFLTAFGLLPKKELGMKSEV